jgi:hypothetical protein
MQQTEERVWSREILLANKGTWFRETQNCPGLSLMGIRHSFGESSWENTSGPISAPAAAQVALLAALPAVIRAARIDPVKMLRAE